VHIGAKLLLKKIGQANKLPVDGVRAIYWCVACNLQYRVLLGGAWNSVCCLPSAASIMENDYDVGVEGSADVVESQRRLLAGQEVRLYTEESVTLSGEVCRCQ
jgi:hypothetical protein